MTDQDEQRNVKSKWNQKRRKREGRERFKSEATKHESKFKGTHPALRVRTHLSSCALVGQRDIESGADMKISSKHDAFCMCVHISIYILCWAK